MICNFCPGKMRIFSSNERRKEIADDGGLDVQNTNRIFFNIILFLFLFLFWPVLIRTAKSKRQNK